jgi:hypothetical protein
VKIRQWAVVAWTLWAISAAGIGLGVAIASWTSAELLEILPLLAGFAAFPMVGAVIAGRRPRNPIGWLFLAIGLLAAVGALGEAYAERAFRRPGPIPPLGVWAAWTQLWFWYPLFAMSTLFTLLLFPSGLPSRRWRPVLWISVIAVAVVTLMAALDPTIRAAGRTVPNPIGVEGLAPGGDVESSRVFFVFSAVTGLALVAATVSIFIRFRRARGVERQQLKWFAYAAALLTLTIALSAAFPAWEATTASQITFGLPVLAIPVACGIAITRYRLYEIDRIINRTIVYGILTALLVGVYVGAAVGLGALARSVTGQENNSLVIAASTLAVAALFGPARRRIQAFIDRRFYRRKYDAAQTLEVFSAKLREQVDLDSLSGELVGVVRESMQPVHASLWLRSPEKSG